jgi:ligand-binding SRPBCC domain-containing protein
MSVTIRRVGRGYVLETSLRVRRPIDEVFEVFADAKNLERLTPPALRFEILTPDPIVMRRGLLLDYRLRLHGVPFRWQSEITVWDPPHRFEDRQRRGPYRWWVHEHSFVEDGDCTLMTDRVSYGVPGGRPIHALFVARDLRNIFHFRAVRFRGLLGLSESEVER